MTMPPRDSRPKFEAYGLLAEQRSIHRLELRCEAIRVCRAIRSLSEASRALF